MDGRHIKIIFFDLGDTLIDMSILPKALNFGLKRVSSNKLVTNEIIFKWEQESYKIFEQYYKKGEFYTVKKLQTISLKNVLSNYGVDLADHKLTDIVDELWRYFIKNCRLYKDVVPTLSRLVQDGYELGLITNADEENVIRILKEHNLNNRFKIKVISSVLKKYKPDLLLFERALELAKCLPQEAVYVDDSFTDIYGAKKLGLITVLIGRDKMQDSMWEIEPDFRINNLQQLSTIIDKTEI